MGAKLDILNELTSILREKCLSLVETVLCLVYCIFELVSKVLLTTRETKKAQGSQNRNSDCQYLAFVETLHWRLSQKS
jgi:hypothetical protein